MLRGRRRRHDPEDHERRPDLAHRRRAGRRPRLNAISCFQANGCAAVGAVASGAAVVRITNDGTNWNAGREHRHAGAERGLVPARRRRASPSARPARPSPHLGRVDVEPGPTGTTNALNAVTCPSSNACYAVGAGGTILKFPNVAERPHAADERHDRGAERRRVRRTRSNCIADGRPAPSSATVDGGSSWTQQGNPLSGPTTALNATSIALNGAHVHVRPLHRRHGRAGRHHDVADPHGHGQHVEHPRHDSEPDAASRTATRRSATRRAARPRT